MLEIQKTRINKKNRKHIKIEKRKKNQETNTNKKEIKNRKIIKKEWKQLKKNT